MANKYRIAVVVGDDIGKEVVPEGIKVADAIGQAFGIDPGWQWFDWRCVRYLETGGMVGENALD